MNSPWDFASASTRHLADARRLYDGDRPDNAQYLAGYVVECSLKAVVERSGLPAERLGHHLLRAQSSGFDMAVSMSPLLARYRPPEDAVQTVRDLWSEHARYYRSGSMASASTARRAVDSAARVWMTCIGGLVLDGLIPYVPE